MSERTYTPETKQQIISIRKDLEKENSYFIGSNVVKIKCVEQFKADKIYFLWIVRRKNDKGHDKEYGFIDILKHEIKLPKVLINLFVFCVLDIKSKLLMINIELDDESLKDVKSIAFVIKNVIYNQA